MTTKPVLVMGARGRVGRQVLRSLSHRGVSARALVRTASTAEPLHGVTEVVGELRDPESLRAAFDGVRSAFFVTPHVEDEEALGQAFLTAAADARVERVVFASAYHAALPNPLVFRLFVAMMGLVTHYGPKLRVEGRVRRSRLSPVVLMPSNFFQNDEILQTEILAGELTVPLGMKGINRVDCVDIGEAAARALTDDSVGAGAWPLVGGERALTGPDCARIWSEALGREVRYEGSFDRWRSVAAKHMQPRELSDFEKTYRILHRVRIAASEAEIARTTELLGRPPRAYAAYVASLARTMTAS